MKTHSILFLIALFTTCSYHSMMAQDTNVLIKKDSSSTSITLKNDILDNELEMAIAKFKKEGILLTVTNIKRNNTGKITGIDLKAKTVQPQLNATFTKNSDIPIKPIIIEYSAQKLNIRTLEPSDLISHELTTLKVNNHEIINDSTKIKNEIKNNQSTKGSPIATSNSPTKQRKNSHKIFINNNPNTITTIIVNGKIVTEDELNEMDSEDIVTIEVRSVRKSNVQKPNDQSHQFTDIITENNPLFILNGKEVDNIDDVNPYWIKNISVLVSDKAVTKYGSKGINGAIEVSTK